MEAFFIDPQHKQWLQRAGLQQYDDFMQLSTGKLISNHDDREVICVELAQNNNLNTFYLKRSLHQKWAKMLACLLHGRRPHCHSFREMLHVSQLQKADIPVMSVIAWGERRWFGIPRQGFLLAEAVSGTWTTTVFENSTPQLRKQLVKAAATLLARLHSAGFYAAPRLKDTIYQYVKNAEARLVLIDRETEQPYPVKFKPARCIKDLAACYNAHQRACDDFCSADIRTFINAYQQSIGEHWPVSALQLLKQLRKQNKSRLLAKYRKKY